MELINQVIYLIKELKLQKYIRKRKRCERCNKLKVQRYAVINEKMNKLNYLVLKPLYKFNNY